MNFQETSACLTPPSFTYTKPSFITSSSINQQRPFDQEITIDMPRKDNTNCKYCSLKGKLVPGANNRCLSHSIKSMFPELKEHLNDYLPTYKEIVNSNHCPQISINDISVNALYRQIEDLYQSIKKVQTHTNSNNSTLQNQMVSTLRQCIELLQKEYVRFDNKQNNTSYTISLQLDVSNEMTEWLKIPIDGSYPHLEQQGLYCQVNEFMNSLQEWNTKRIPDMFLKLVDSIQQKFELNHIMFKQYQMSMNQMNKKLLSYMEKISSNNRFKQLQDDLNFIQHISSLGQMTIRNFSNNSSLMLKKKSFDDHQGQNDLLKFVLLQASAIQKILPQVLSQSILD